MVGKRMKNPIYFIEDFEKNCNTLNIPINKITGIKRDEIFNIFCSIFLKKTSFLRQEDQPLWDFFNKNITGVHLPNASSCREKFIDLIPNVEKVYFMFEREFSKEIYFFENSKLLMDVLKECYNFNFYVFNTDFDLLLGWETYETLFAYGLAKKWLEYIGSSWLLIEGDGNQSLIL